MKKSISEKIKTIDNKIEQSSIWFRQINCKDLHFIIGKR